MGNFASAGGSGKIVLPDGTVRALGEPVSVAELMVEYPCHFVVDARLVSSGAAKVAALPADDVLHGAGVYVVLPATRGRISAEEARRVLGAASRPLARFPSMPAGAGAQDDKAAAVCLGELGDHRPEFLTRKMTSGGPWKPSLKTIEELSLPRKVSTEMSCDYETFSEPVWCCISVYIHGKINLTLHTQLSALARDTVLNYTIPEQNGMDCSAKLN
uniref:Uncharacterized protein n=1 Tax=Avena sativa TaxID=4498 RepID=A0ACD5WQX0_AVESA